MSGLFQPAARHQRKLRMALVGPSGSGKTFTALTIAEQLGGRIAVIDTERGSASAYADNFTFDTLQLTTFAPEKYLEGIKEAGAAGYNVLIIDSLSHAWAGKDGILEFVDKVTARSRASNSFASWREATPVHNRLVDGILDAGCHVIVTMRSKTEYVQERDEKGKTVIRKVGLQPIQRDGLEYEFDIVADLDTENTLIVSKTRCAALRGHVEQCVGADFANIIIGWVGTGTPAPPKPVEAPQANGHLSRAKADSLEQSLIDLGVRRGDILLYVSDLVGRQVDSLTDLTTGEALAIYKAASSEVAGQGRDLEPPPTRDYVAANEVPT